MCDKKLKKTCKKNGNDISEHFDLIAELQHGIYDLDHSIDWWNTFECS